MAMVVVTAALIDPVTFDDAQDHMRIDGELDKAWVETHITSATRMIELSANRTLIETTWDLFLDRFPSAGVIRVPKPPLSSVTSVKYTDTGGTTKTVTASDYQVDTNSAPGRIKPAFAKAWPSTRDDFNAVEVRLVAGYGTAVTDVPEGLRLAVLKLLAHWFEHREEVIVGTTVAKLPMSVESLIWQHRIPEAA